MSCGNGDLSLCEFLIATDDGVMGIDKNVLRRRRQKRYIPGDSWADDTTKACYVRVSRDKEAMEVGLETNEDSTTPIEQNQSSSKTSSPIVPVFRSNVDTVDTEVGLGCSD